MDISAQLVKELREKTGAGLMECKKALLETSGDIDKSIKYLKEKGMIKAAEKSGRATNEGIIIISTDSSNQQGVIVEITCETDFVARTDDFINTSQEISDDILKSSASKIEDIPDQISNKLKALISRLGENMSINRMERISGSNSQQLTSYIHQGGKIGVLLQTDGDQKLNNNDDFINLTKDISMHIAAMNPVGLSKEDVDPKLLEEQKEIFTKQSKESGKPDNIIEKMVIGKINQFLKEIVLLDQAFVKDPKLSIAQLIQSVAKKLNTNINVKKFIRYKVGD